MQLTETCQECLGTGVTRGTPCMRCVGTGKWEKGIVDDTAISDTLDKILNRVKKIAKKLDIPDE